MNQLPFSLSNSPLGFLCPLIGFIIVVAIIVFIVRALARTGSGAADKVQSPLPDVITQLGEDGFWIVSCPAELGSMIHYHFWAAGEKHAGRVPFQPGNDGRQFVYTGARPDQVSIVRIVEPSDDLMPDIVPPIVGAAATLWGSSSDNQPDTFSAPPSSSGFPSAY